MSTGPRTGSADGPDCRDQATDPAPLGFFDSDFLLSTFDDVAPFLDSVLVPDVDPLVDPLADSDFESLELLALLAAAALLAVVFARLSVA